MAIEQQNIKDAEAILSHRADNGADYWATLDGRIMKGSPFTTLYSMQMLLELGMEPDTPVLQQAANLVFEAWREDGRFKIAPSGGIYPCHTIHCAQALCHMGYAKDPKLEKTFEYLLATTYADGGWRCNKFSFGRGPETEYSNPGPTLTALDVFRFTRFCNTHPALDKAVGFLLEHWDIRRPIGPCHYGIGSLFMQPEYPLGGYNIFTYVYVLSFYNSAKQDPRFLKALAALEATMENGQIIVQRCNSKLAKFEFCKKGRPSSLATKRYEEIIRNIN